MSTTDTTDTTRSSGRNANEELEPPTRAATFARGARKVAHNKSALVGLGILVPIIMLSLFGPFLPLASAYETNAQEAFAPPSAEHPFGTDTYGRDLLSRVINGGRTSLLIGVTPVLLGLLFAVPIGLVAGYYGGNVDESLMRFMDLLLSFPSLLLALLIIVALGSSMWNAIIAITLVFIPRIARVVRGSVLSVKTEEFIEAAEARGESDIYIMKNEILPNITTPILVEATIRVGFAILIGTAISFLGLGTQPPNPDWGFMIEEGRTVMYQSPWYLLWPSVFLGLTVVGLNILGDGIRDALDPKEGT
ncbi:ABC transporter permease [Salinigranum marinum]|uniref:ABC transporter permease n=1 Tax=Salinigranum marinum TaxID=1515595 RepID=UPI002989B80D|nr:ABC transporter permease [Salinigranum marinum]